MEFKRKLEVSSKSQEELILLAREILKERNALCKTAKTVDELEQTLKNRYSDFTLEFPSVFETIVNMGVFYVQPFQKYLEFRSKQPRVYTKEEDSLRDLCKYPLLLWKYANPHYDQQEYLQYKQQLQQEIRKSYVKTKQEFKLVNDEFIAAKEKRALERKKALITDLIARAKLIQSDSCTQE